MAFRADQFMSAGLSCASQDFQRPGPQECQWFSAAVALEGVGKLGGAVSQAWHLVGRAQRCPVEKLPLAAWHSLKMTGLDGRLVCLGFSYFCLIPTSCCLELCKGTCLVIFAERHLTAR